ncbi:MAG: hypothetical protein ACF8OB_11650 [Phycisphaeraceae bacterium JB051]
MRLDFAMKTCLLSLMCLLVSHGYAQEKQPGNLVVNGDFEKALTGWHWEEWKGYKVPGYVDRADFNQGNASFKLTVPDLHERRQMGLQIKGIKPGKDYTLKIDLMCEDLAKDGAMVRMLLFTKDENGKSKPNGWVDVPAGSGVNAFITLSGTQDWKTHTVPISAKAIPQNISHVWIMIDHKDVGSGVVGIDNIQMYETQAQDKTDQSQTSASSIKTFTYDIADPTVILPVENAKVLLKVTPDQTLYRVGQLPQIKLKTQAIDDAVLDLQIKNGFGEVVFEKVGRPLGKSLDEPVNLPGDRGYFELIATAKTTDGQIITQVRRTFGILTPPAPTDTDEPWGLWCNGREDFVELGVRWTRPALYWYFYNKDAKAYMAKTIKMIDENHAKGIKVLMYPKDHPSHHAITQKVFKDTPEAWAEVREYWTYLVKSLAGKADAWGLINEPYRGMWAGTDELILRYWQMMHEIVEEHAPDTPVIGPSLNVNEPSMMAQYTELMQAGLGKHIDGVELHTYTATAMPEDIDWESNIAQARKVTRQYASDLPLYSTEMGMSMGYDNELYQAQYLARCFVWAKKMDLKMLLYHMYSWPQGEPLSERDFAIFRSDPKRVAPSQPRPAGLVYGVMTRQLAAATYRTQVDYLGPAVKAFVFEKQGQPMLAIWRTDTRKTTVDLAITTDHAMVTDLFGQQQKLVPDNGIVSLTIGPSMRFVSGIGSDYLNVKPLVQTPPTLTLQAGGKGQTQLTLTNPNRQSATLTLKWITPENWQVDDGGQPITLPAGSSITIPVTVQCPAYAKYEQTVLYARAKLDGKLVTPARLPVRVEPRVIVEQVKPALAHGKPVIAMTLKRLDDSLEQVHVQMDELADQARFTTADTLTMQLPVKANDTASQLHEYAITLSDGKREQDARKPSLSFVPTPYAGDVPRIDGDLSEWSNLPTPTREQPVVAWRWDRENLYLAVKAVDEKHIQDQRPETLWRQDSIQIGLGAFDFANWVRKPIGEMRESDHTELTVGGPGSGKAFAYCHATLNKQACPMGEVGRDPMPAAVISDGRITRYEVAIPISLAGLKALESGTIIRASVLLNTNDGGRRGYIEWFSGIGRTKSPDLYGHLILEP